jgi:N-acetylglucosaminyldiphosphoundecaprenol N-acetyl-beta-D-mannosaminyltransferase
MTTPLPPRYPVLDVAISALTPREAVSLVLEWVARREKHFLNVCTADTILQCHDRPELAAIANAASLALPDGMPLVWMGRLQGCRVERVYGPDLMLALCDKGRDGGVRHYFYGGTEDVLKALEAALVRRFPGLKIAGSWAPPFRPLTLEEKADAMARINEAAPDIVWVGIGTPKQDFWVSEFRPRLHAPVLIPVGAAFNFHAGAVRQAPRWMGRVGLEWLFRLLMEPRRLWKRYLFGNARFVFLVLAQGVRAIMRKCPAAGENRRSNRK